MAWWSRRTLLCTAEGWGRDSMRTRTCTLSEGNDASGARLKGSRIVTVQWRRRRATAWRARAALDRRKSEKIKFEITFAAVLNGYFSAARYWLATFESPLLFAVLHVTQRRRIRIRRQAAAARLRQCRGGRRAVSGRVSRLSLLVPSSALYVEAKQHLLCHSGS